MRFTKMQGLGNDYIFVDATKKIPEHPEKLAVRLSDRHFGIGADGLVLILKSDAADFRMQMFNSDGSEGKMCGNAARCIGKYVYERGLTRKTALTLETASGIKKLFLNLCGDRVDRVSVDMGEPQCDGVFSSITVNGNSYSYLFVDMGNPHCVIFKDPHTFDWHAAGKAIENDPVFQDKTNVEFVRVLSDNMLEMRVWERGSGETLACGTGACAAAVAAVRAGWCDPATSVMVLLSHGALQIRVDRTVVMTGPAETVFDGEINETLWQD